MCQNQWAFTLCHSFDMFAEVKTSTCLTELLMTESIGSNRNFGLGDKNVKYELRTLKHQRNEVVMTVGKHTVQVACKNKRDGKQRAAQGILQALHPHIWSWGSLLRLYGSHSLKTVKEKKQEEQQITLLQSKGAVNAPNYAILDKLRTEMTKLKEIRVSVHQFHISCL